MSRIARWLAAGVLAFAGGLGTAAGEVATEAAGGTGRIVIAGGDLTEIAWALGAGERVVGVDTTSTWPPAAAGLPQIGYVRSLSAEGVLSLTPDLLLAAADAGPDIALDQLRAAGVTVAVAPAADQVGAIPAKIAFVGDALGLDAEAEQLAEAFTAKLAAVREKVGRLDDRPRVLFILAARNGAPLVAGEGTSADGMIALAAGQNAATGFQGYKPMSEEAIIAARPDVILMMQEHAEQIGGASAVLDRPEIALTPAGRAGRVIAMPGMLLLGFGPRTPAAIAELARLLHPDGAPEAGL